MMGSSGCVTVSEGPKRQRRAATSASSSSFTVRATADEVQISASHGMTGAVSNAVTSFMDECEAVVWVTPQRL
jgi:hypothetical protein